MNTQTRQQSAAADSHMLHSGYVSVAEIIVDAPASAVWPHLVNIGSWIYDFHFEHISGTAGAEGEVRYLWPIGAEMPEGAVTISDKNRTLQNAIVLKTLAAIPEKLWYGVNPLKENEGV